METSKILNTEAFPAVKNKGKVSLILSLVLLFIALVAFFSARWYIRTYGDTGFDSVIYTLFSDLKGVQAGLIGQFLLGGLLPAVICFLAVGFVLFWKHKKELFIPIKNKKIKALPLMPKMAKIISLVLSAILLITAGTSVKLFDYLYSLTHQSTIFTEKYVDPDTVNLQFPEKKKNLIYIFLESMETTFQSKEEGGALEHNTTPELTKLAKQYVNFSHNEGVGGFVTPTGMTWTVAAMTAHTAGIPLKAPGIFERNAYGTDTFLPGVTNLTNILKENGYYQALMVGSDKSFANRDVYYETHGIDKIYDLNTAREDGIVPENYYVWWGMEDEYLFKYAKRELVKIAAQEQPFAFSMLTVDTHHVAGYKCELCGEVYEEQYENVISCASKQVNMFMNWLRRQSFYKNTTVVIVGDHLTMDSEYITRNVAPEYKQHVYNCFINSSVTGENYKNRQFCAVDLFPTTLAAMGVEIPGNRLGLGTNLFSNKKTLIEEMGYEEFNNQIAMNSSYYITNFLSEPEE